MPAFADDLAGSVIVVIDDRASNREIYARLAALTAADAAVKTFVDRADALAWLGDNRPDLVVTDFKMPGMPAAEFILRVRRLYESADLPIIVITAHEDRQFRRDALEAGATDFLQSPVDHNEFVTRARNLLRLSHQQKLIRARADNLQQELDASEQSREEVIRNSRRRLAEVIDTVPALMLATDDQGRELFLNSYGAQLIADGLVIRPADADDQARQAQAGAPVVEQSFIDRAGRQRTLLTSRYPMRRQAGEADLILTTAFDITSQKSAEQAMQRLAHEDGLTGLPNRLALNTSLVQEIGRPPAQARPFALHFIDLDRFKGINDVFGHDHGDMLLRETAARLRRYVRKGDLVVRLGGDEFALVQYGVDSYAEADLLASRILDGLRPQIAFEHRSVSISASIGYTLWPADGATVDELMKNADLAMYHAKANGRGRASAFDRKMVVDARDTVLLELDLRDGLDRGELTLEYQPQVNVVNGRMIGVEALLRWRRSNGDVAYPGSFLHIAAASGLLVPIEHWVLAAACRQGAAWARAGMPIRVSVNVSSSAFQTQNVQQLVERTLADSGLEPTLLELELTETTLLENQREAAEELHALRRLGVRVAIDDFGTGFSSLAYLRTLPVDRLKIDQSFIRGLGADPGDTAIVKAIIAIGRSLGLDVMSEGVETVQQVNWLLGEGCTTAQGFLYSQALEPAGLADYLEGRRFPIVA